MDRAGFNEHPSTGIKTRFPEGVGEPSGGGVSKLLSTHAMVEVHPFLFLGLSQFKKLYSRPQNTDFAWPEK